METVIILIARAFRKNYLQHINNKENAYTFYVLDALKGEEIMERARTRTVSDIEKLLVLLHRNGDIRGRTRFQKLVFLLKEEFHINFGYKFIPYRYGPYSHDLRYEIDMLDISGEIDVTPEDTSYVHHLTESGRRIAEQAEQEMGDRELSNLSTAVERLGRISTRTLIKRAKRLAGIP